jgi:D-alanyl-D-alanine carboxypeptidase (penicillin-binding protein 5/6)
MTSLRLLLAFLVMFAFTPLATAATKKTTSKSTPSKTTSSKSTASKTTSKKASSKSSDDDEDSDDTGTSDGTKNPDDAKKELAPGELPLFARSAVALDGQTGDVLYEKNADAMEFPASSTKILTALVIIESGDLEKIVTIEERETKVEPSSLETKTGEQFSRRNLLYALMLKSANDVAEALARDNAGSVAAFAEKMNARALAAGAESSHFANPHGLHDPHHYTTARDLAKITRAAMQNPLFREIVSTRGAWLRKSDEWIFLRNKNRLLTRLPECIGVKTGYTRAAQQVLVSAAAKDGKETISVVLHTNRPGIWDDSLLLLKHGLAKLLPQPAPLQPVSPPPASEPAADGNADEGKPATSPVGP